MRLFLDTNILVELIENRSSADYVYEIISHHATDEHQLFISIGGFVLLTINIRDFRGVEKESIPIMTPATFVSRYMRVS